MYQKSFPHNMKKNMPRNLIFLLVDIIYYVHKLLKFDIVWHDNDGVLAWVIL